MPLHLTAPLERVVPVLARESGTRLAVAANLKGEVVHLSLLGPADEEALRRVARAVEAEWRVGPDGTRTLVRSAETFRAQEARSVARRAAAYREALARRAKPDALFDLRAADGLARRLEGIARRINTERPTPDDPHAALFRERSGTPVARALTRLLDAVGPEVLAAVPPGERVVFSDRPTRRQLAFPRAVGPILDRLVTEQEVWTKAAAWPEDGYTPPGQEGTFFFSGSARPLPAPPERTLLIFEPWRDGASVRLLLTDLGGRTVAESQENLGADWDDLRRLAAPKPGDADAPRIAPNPVLDAFLAATRWEGRTALTPEAAARFRDAARRDPLDPLVGDGLAQLARKTRRNVVALLADDAAEDLWADPAAKERSIPAPAFLRRLARRNDVREEPGWVTLAPLDPVLARRERSDRRALADLMAERERFGLDERAALAWRLVDHRDRPLARKFAEAVFPAPLPGLRAGWGDPALWLFGSFDRSARAAAARPEGVPLSTLAPAQRAALDREVGRGRIMFSSDPPDRPGTSTWTEIASEPTEVFPDGLPPATRVRLADLSAWSVEFGGKSSRTYPRFEGTEGAALRIDALRRPARYPGRPADDASRLRAFRRRDVRLSLAVTPILHWTGELAERTPPTPWGPFGSLPPELRREIEAEIARGFDER